MTDAIIICLIAAVVVLMAIGLIDHKIRKLGKLMNDYKIEIDSNLSNYYNLLDNRLIDLTIELSKMNNRNDRFLEAMKILTDVTKENTDRIDCLHEYLNIFDDTVITTIRDNYSDTREIKDILNKIDIQTVEASVEYSDENFRKMLGANGKGE